MSIFFPFFGGEIPEIPTFPAGENYLFNLVILELGVLTSFLLGFGLLFCIPFPDALFMFITTCGLCVLLPLVYFSFLWFMGDQNFKKDIQDFKAWLVFFGLIIATLSPLLGALYFQ